MIKMRERFYKSNLMTQKFEIGQKVVITPIRNQHLSPRDSDLEPYAGRIGEIADIYWISSIRGEVFYLYNVRMETDGKEVVIHEDELTAYIA